MDFSACQLLFKPKGKKTKKNGRSTSFTSNLSIFAFSALGGEYSGLFLWTKGDIKDYY
jgi:hypothetical protein